MRRNDTEQVRAVPRGWVLALTISLAACASNGHNYHDRAMDFGAVRAVAVLPLTNLTRDTLAGERVKDVLSTMLLASGAVYVVPEGEVARAISRAGLATAATAPSTEDLVKLGAALKADALILGVVREYGEVRSGNAVSNICSLSLQMIEATTGKVVWTAATTKGGVGIGDRLLGGGGRPLNDVTEAAVNDLLDKLLK
jgi:hypothetical protein